MVCVTCLMVHIKDPLMFTGKSSPWSSSNLFLSRYVNGPLPYVWRHITRNKICWVCCYINKILSLLIMYHIYVLNKITFNCHKLYQIFVTDISDKQHIFNTGRKKMFYLTMHSTHFNMVIWCQTYAATTVVEHWLESCLILYYPTIIF